MPNYQTDYQTRPILICGAGNMGRRMAVTLAVLGNPVHLYDDFPKARALSAAYVKEYLPKTVAALPADIHAKAGKITIFDNMQEAIQDAWLAIESIPEILDIKTEMLSRLEKIAPKDCIIASNSSSFMSSQLIGKISDPSRVLNIHFYRPPEMKVVEIMSCGKTKQEIIDFLMKIMPKFGLAPFFVREESVGFIFNRIWAAMRREALYVASKGIATPKDIDAMFGYMGDFRGGAFHLMDEIGLDVVYDVEQHYAQEHPNIPPEPRRYLQQDYLEKGKLGRKSGSGFFDYPKEETL